MTMQAAGMAAGPRIFRRRVLGLAGGAAVLGLGALALWDRVLPGPAAPPLYAYAAASGPEAQVSAPGQALAARLAEGAETAVLELRIAEGDRALARVEVATTAEGGRHLLGWQSLGALPILRRDIHPEEEQHLIEALEKHLPAGSRILAMPDVSRRLLGAIEAQLPLAAAAEPLILPPPWQGSGATVAALEAAQWAGPAAAGVQDQALAGFLDALLAEDVHGAAQLRVLAGLGETYVLVHLEDIFLLGQLREGRLEMARRSFAAGSFSHDLAREARAWGQLNGHAAWAVDRAPDGRLRGHYLTDEAETATLIAQLLPFSTSRLDMVAGLRLVWQSGNYWLYRLDDIAPAE